MAIFVGALVLALVFAVAAYAIGREARRLNQQPARAIFDLDEAVTFVADRLPFEVAAVLSHDDVRQIIRWHLEYLRTKGVSSNGEKAHQQAPIVVAGAETVDYVLTRASASGLELTAAQAHVVIEMQLTYLEQIGLIENAPGDEPPPVS